jgi:allantoinase
VLFRGGTVVSAHATRRADVRVADGRIVEVATGVRPQGDAVIDVDGLHLFPGAVDPHVHQWEPGFASRPDFADATASAAVGGVTTLLDHPLTPPVVTDATRFAAKVALGKRSAVIDFGLHGGVDPTSVASLPDLWAAGATGIKLFTCPTGGDLGCFADGDALSEVFERLAALGALALVHAEDAAVLDREREALGRGRDDGVADFPRWHSLEAELAAVDVVLALAARTRTRTYIVHASDPAVVERVRAASSNARVWVETCPHYLQLDAADLDRLGARGMTAPPVRDATARAGLIEQFAAGRIDALGSDHCAVTAEGKDVATMDALIPGVPALDVYLPLVLDLALRHGIDLSRVAAATATQPAATFGLPGKGAIETGRDADIVAVDLDASTSVEAARLPSAAGWTPYEGMTLRGAVTQTWSRGELVAVDGQPFGRPGRGRFVAREEGA